MGRLTSEGRGRGGGQHHVYLGTVQSGDWWVLQNKDAVPLLPDLDMLVHNAPGSPACWGDRRDHAADLVRDAAVLLGHARYPCHEAPGPSLEVLDQTALGRLVPKAEQDQQTRRQ